ncbi:ribosomal protein L23 [Peptostreptococcaceae bacterium AS15]|jgi:ribosomal protein L23|nr:ribosomal protein L23 [Peptostreptococcaceae bacterium AS15]MBF1051108.1 50S ribosomal protein L23 [Peptostreptococcaceae bacterium]
MISYDIIKRPVISERSMEQSAEKKYTFIVDKKANKTQIKKAVEEIFEVKVDKVSTMNYDGRKKRVGKYVGTTASFKKAIVKLTADSKEIEIFGA